MNTHLTSLKGHTPAPSQEGRTHPYPSQEGNGGDSGEIPLLGGELKGWVIMRKKIIPYNPKLKELARELRNNSTLSEVLLWRCVKGKQMLGYDFDRQKPIDNYIVDFFCNELMLAIEIDGCSHNDRIEEDVIRQKRLEALGISFLRFNDLDVKQNIEGVVAAIEEWVRQHTAPSQEGRAHT